MSRVGKESTPTSTARDRLTNDLIMMTAEAQDPTSMGNSTSTTTTTTTVMTTNITVVMTMTSTRTTRVDTRVTTVVMEVEVSLSRRTLVRLNASSARKWGIMQMNAQKRKLKDPTSPTLSRRGKLTTLMWRRSMRSLMLWLVSLNSILFQHLFSLILVHIIHSYQEHLLK